MPPYLIQCFDASYTTPLSSYIVPLIQHPFDRSPHSLILPSYSHPFPPLCLILLPHGSSSHTASSCRYPLTCLASSLQVPLSYRFCLVGLTLSQEVSLLCNTLFPQALGFLSSALVPVESQPSSRCPLLLALVPVEPQRAIGLPSPTPSSSTCRAPVKL